FTDHFSLPTDHSTVWLPFIWTVLPATVFAAQELFAAASREGRAVMPQRAQEGREREAVLEARRQARARRGEPRLYRSGKLDGLFPAGTGAAGCAAEVALRDGLLEVARTETRGKTAADWVRLTPRGVDFLHEHESPLRALHDLR